MARIGITMGCPVSIGPEIILKFFAARSAASGHQPVVIGDLGVLRQCALELGLSIPPLRSWNPGEPANAEAIWVYERSRLDPQNLRWGKPDGETGLAMARYIETAVELAQSGAIDALVTCPIAKTGLRQAGYSYPGHTEMLAELTGARRFTMMMAGTTLRLTLVTIHCGLAEVAAAVNADAVAERIRLTHESLQRDFAIPSPRLAVAGLNPHAGEEGLFGGEEQAAIVPAITQARQEGIDARGPFPPDTVFVKAAHGDYDAVVCMYHDQGLIPFKLLHFSDGVNVTIGLPIVRTSVDHGTAYDIAGRGIADAASLTQAFALAAAIAENRKIWKDER